MPVFESPELAELFRTYTASPDSVAAHLSDAVAAAADGDPLVVATGTDIALYPGGGRPPAVLPIRTATRGFKELAAVSHLGPAVATVLRMKDLGGAWHADTRRLIDACRKARAASSVSLWRDEIAVAAYAGREAGIAALVDYGCRVTERYLELVADVRHGAGAGGLARVTLQRRA